MAYMVFETFRTLLSYKIYGGVHSNYETEKVRTLFENTQKKA
jgi:hypothetical protein